MNFHFAFSQSGTQSQTARVSAFGFPARNYKIGRRIKLRKTVSIFSEEFLMLSSTAIKNFLPAVFAVICLTVFAANAQSKYQPPPSPTPPVEEEAEKVFSEEIKLNVNAFDPDGKFVADVKKEDLVILEDGRIHQASSIRRLPANVLIVLDTGGELRAAKSLTQTRATARRLISTLNESDSVAIMQYNDRAEIVAEWTDKATALKLLNTKANFGKRSMLYNALAAAVKFIRKTATDNRHLVLISDGTDSLNNQTEKDQAMRNLLTTDISVHVLSYTQMELADIAPRAKGISKTPVRIGLPPGAVPNPTRSEPVISSGVTINTDREFLKRMRARKKSLEEAEKFLSDLATDTNGEFILPADAEEMLQKTALVASFIDSSYVITYAPKRTLSDAKSGELRVVTVSSRRPDLQIEARRKLIVANEKIEVN